MLRRALILGKCIKRRPIYYASTHQKTNMAVENPHFWQERQYIFKLYFPLCTLSPFGKEIHIHLQVILVSIVMLVFRGITTPCPLSSKVTRKIWASKWLESERCIRTCSEDGASVVWDTSAKSVKRWWSSGQMNCKKGSLLMTWRYSPWKRWRV